ncbi:MAG: hypothetical protein QM713_14310 [Arachnia sp.]
MSTPAADGGARGRVGAALRRGWFWGVDYAWVLRALGTGIVGRVAPGRYDSGGRATVVLLPGVLEEWTMMRPVADALSAAGHPVRTLPELRRNTATVDEAAALVEAFLAASGLRDIVLVAHSKGGLIGKRVLLGAEGARVRRLIAIATPFAGSSLARLIPWRIVRSLAPDDATILELSGHAEVNDRIVSVYPSFDPHIPGGSRLEGAANVPVAAMGHFRVLADPEVLTAVLAAARE